MENLTINRRIAYQATDLHPVPGHDLVIFRKIGSGLEFRSLIREGETFKSKWFENKSTLISYAVLRDPNLRHEFSKKYVHSDQVHTFTLHFTLLYRVSDPRRFVEVLKSDPLRRLEYEVGMIIGTAVRHLPWSAISHEDGIQTVLEQEGNGTEGVIRENLKQAQIFASEYGIELKEFLLEYSLPKPEFTQHLENEIVLRDLDFSRQQLDQQRLELRQRLLLDDISKAAIRAISQAATDSSRFSDLSRTIQELQSFSNTLHIIAKSTEERGQQLMPLALSERKPGAQLHLVACMMSFAPSLHWSLTESFEGQLRRVYPHISTPRGPSGPLVFYSDPGQEWAIWFTASAIGLETSRFHHFDEFQDRLGNVVRILRPELHTELYSQISLRCVYSVPPSVTVSSRSLPPETKHLGQMFRWRCQGERAYIDLDVFAENIQPARFEEQLEEIFEEARLLSPSEELIRQDTQESLPDNPPLVFDDPPSAPPEAEAIAEERAALLNRKYNGPGLSFEEGKRLETLTARLNELLPPVSVADLEVLVQMVEEAEQIRERARERRRRLDLS